MSLSVPVVVVRSALAVGVVVCSGCFATDLQVVVELDGSVDAMSVGDAGRADGGLVMDGGYQDGRVAYDASSGDGQVDSGPRDGGPDASSVDSGSFVCVCAPASECHVSTCTAQGCGQALAPNGLRCNGSDLHACVDGICVPRGCGDGYREPGPQPVREGCDDGNLVSGDGCDSLCVEETRTIGTDPTGTTEALPPWKANVVGVDGPGNMLAIFERVVGSQTELRGSRFDSRGRWLPTSTGDGTLLIDGTLPVPSQADPTVAGLRDGGFVVAWTDFRVGTYDVVFQVVLPDGSLGNAGVLNATFGDSQYGASLAGWNDGFVGAWTTAASIVEDLNGGIRARVFGADGTPYSEEFPLAADRTGTESAVRLAAVPSGVIAVYVRQEADRGYVPHVRVRRFFGSTPLDAADLELGEGDEPSVDTFDESSFVVVRTAYAADYRGDILATEVPSSGPLASGDVAVAATANLAERSGFVSAFPSHGAVVAFQRGTGFTLAGILGFVATSDYEELRARIEADAIERPTMTRTHDGLAFGYRGFLASAPTYVFHFYLLGLP